jgi:NAD(P)H dehydrogenase (quinone)
MKILVILGHPDKDSFNHAIAQTVRQQLVRNKHEVILHDLYLEKFPPLLEREEIPKHTELDSLIRQHCAELSSAEGIIIIHPNWWGQPPAILKGWIDRIFRPGVAYEFLEDDSGERIPVGLLQARIAIVLNTSNTNEVREKTVFGDPLEYIWKNCIFDLCGVEEFYRKTFGIVVSSTMEERTHWLNETKTIINTYFPKK